MSEPKKNFEHASAHDGQHDRDREPDRGHDTQDTRDKAPNRSHDGQHATEDGAAREARHNQDRTAQAAHDIKQTTNRAADAAQDIQQNTMKAGEAGREQLKKVGEEARRIAYEGVQSTSKAVDAYVKSGKEASASIAELTESLTAAYGQSLSGYRELSRQALTVRSFEDIVAFHGNALQKLQDHMLGMSKVYGLSANVFAKATGPLVQSASLSRERRQDKAA